MNVYRSKLNSLVENSDKFQMVALRFKDAENDL